MRHQPAYWGLRDYSIDGQIGAEATIDASTRSLQLFSAVRALRDDGTLWLVSVTATPAAGGAGAMWTTRTSRAAWIIAHHARWPETKDLIGVPWRLAFALQADEISGFQASGRGRAGSPCRAR